MIDVAGTNGVPMRGCIILVDKYTSYITLHYIVDGVRCRDWGVMDDYCERGIRRWVVVLWVGGGVVVWQLSEVMVLFNSDKIKGFLHSRASLYGTR